jgi:hypothetical protein
LYATELAAAHLAAGRSVDDALMLPPRLEQLVAGRLDRLSPAAGEAAAAIAGLATPTVAQLTVALPEGATEAVAELHDQGVVSVREGELQFTHPLFALAALDRLGPSARRTLHRRLATAASTAEERGHHLVLSADGPDEEIAVAAERAADRARTRGAPRAAARLAEAAARLTPRQRPDDRRRRLVAAAYHRVAGGQVGAGRGHMAGTRSYRRSA